MRKELSDIFQAITTKWTIANQQLTVKELQDAPRGATSGTEGLLMMIEYLTGVTQDHPEVIALIHDEMVDLVLYCTGHGIIVNDTLLSRFSTAANADVAGSDPDRS